MGIKRKSRIHAAGFTRWPVACFTLDTRMEWEREGEVIMATPVLMSLTSALLGSGTSEVLGACGKLAERVKAAHDNYQQTAAQATDTVENERHEAICKINELRNRAALGVADPELQQKIWCLLMEQTAEAYEATTARGVSLVKDTTGQIESLLSSYQQTMNYRRRARAVAVLVSVLSLAGIGYFLYFAQASGMKGETTLPVLGVPSCVLLWSVIGSFAAILYRFSNAGDRELEDPLRWLFSRPLTGVIMGAITFLVLRAGLLTMSPGPDASSVEKLGTNEIMWLVAFLAGFSDRFADGLLKSLVGRFGGEKNSDLIAMQMTSKQTSARVLNQLTSLVNRGKNTPASAAVAGPDTTGRGKSQTLALVEQSETALASLAN